MRKIINFSENYVDEMLEGIYAAHPDSLRMVNGQPRCLVRTCKTPGKVALATGGGSGHLPLFLGYVGDGLLDGCSVGEVFQAPSADHMLEVTREIDAGAGTLYIFGNYNGDKFNFRMAAEMAQMEYGIPVELVILGDDIAVKAPADGEESRRRGVAGIFFAFKCAGAAAKEGMNLQQVKEIALRAGARTRSIGVALSPCVIPRAGIPGFSVEEGKMEIGMGIHGEPGIRVANLGTADEIVDEMMEALLEDMPCGKGDEVAVLINSLGATPLDELYIMARRISQVLAQREVKGYRFYVGEYATSMEMAGTSVSIFKLDDELKRLLDAPADSPFFKQFQMGGCDKA